LGTKLGLEQPVPAAPDEVYAAWTSADGLARWWWPHLPDTTYEVDARVGGTYEIRSRPPASAPGASFWSWTSPGSSA
jgi:uncharacterized protein YndB with AHSA1/START domain